MSRGSSSTRRRWLSLVQVDELVSDGELGVEEDSGAEGGRRARMGIRFGGRRRLRTGAEPRRLGSSWENGKVLWGGRPPGERDEEKKINRRRRWRRQVWSVCLLEWEQAGGWGQTGTERKRQGRTRQRQAGAGADRVRLKRPARMGPRERDCGGKGRSLWGRSLWGRSGRGRSERGRPKPTTTAGRTGSGRTRGRCRTRRGERGRGRGGQEQAQQERTGSRESFKANFDLSAWCWWMR